MHDDLLTALDDDRMNEAPYKYKYPETDFDGTKKIKKIEWEEKIINEYNTKLNMIKKENVMMSNQASFSIIDKKKKI